MTALGAMTFRITTLAIIAVSITILSIKTHSKSFRITTLPRDTQIEHTMYVENFLEILYNDIQHKGLNSNTVKIIVIIIMLRKVMAEGHYAECRYEKCHSAIHLMAQL
jgi:hypothetical protein